MDKRRARITYALLGATLILAAWAASAMPRLRSTPKTLPTTDVKPEDKPKQDPPPVVQVPQVRPKIEVVFALDTTGSMSGLIDGAKRKIWSIAHYIASGQPKPELRVGLVAYRDKGDEYVTRVYDLTDDLDTVFEHLSSFEAAGGGDTPEHVSKALYDSVYKMSWSQDGQVLKQVYLVGDAPPHTDYNDGFDYRKIAAHAKDVGIHINTIRCGGDRETQLVWNQIATAASGEYASIDQSGGVVAIATPYDDKLAELNGKLASSAIGYGRWRGEVAAKAHHAAAMPTPMAADRAATFGLMGGSVGGAGDIIDDALKGRAKVDTMAAEDLPVEMRGMDGAGRKKFVAEKNAERERMQKEINELATRRDAYMKAKAPKDSFDARVEGTIKSQAASVGVRY
jgi:Mg-chelatase subunit ChlD